MFSFLVKLSINATGLLTMYLLILMILRASGIITWISMPMLRDERVQAKPDQASFARGYACVASVLGSGIPALDGLGCSTAGNIAEMPSLVRILVQLSLARGTLAGVTEMDEMEECIKILPQCVDELWKSNQRGGGDATNEEELIFGLLAAWMKGLYTKKDPPYLASDLQLRASTLKQLKELASFSLASPDHFKYAIGVGQMLFLYFWWGLHPPDDEHSRLLGPSIEVVSLSASLHTASVAGSCSSPSMAQIEFEERKCPWR